MRYLKMDDVKHLKEKEHGSKIQLLASIVAVARRINEENPNSTQNKKSKNNSTSPKSVPNFRREISSKPMKENYQSCCSSGMLKFKFDRLLIGQELPTSSCSKSLKIQEAPTASGSNSLKKIEEMPTISGLKSMKREGKASSSCSPTKKRKVGDEGPAPGLPQCFKDLILELGGGREVSEPILVVQKELFASDILTDQNRFMIPRKQMKPFLHAEEIASLPLQEVAMIEPNLEIGSVTVAKWKMSSDVYVLRGNWSKIVKRNSLGKGMIVQLWAVRIDDQLLLLLVRLPPSIPQGCNNAHSQASDDRDD